MLNKIKGLKDSLQRDKLIEMFGIIEIFNEYGGSDYIIDTHYNTYNFD